MDRRGFLGSVIGTVVAGLGLADVAAAGARRHDFVARPPGPYTALTPLERLEAAVRLMRGGDALRRACRGIWFAGDPAEPAEPAEPAVEFLTPGWKTTGFDAVAAPANTWWPATAPSPPTTSSWAPGRWTT